MGGCLDAKDMPNLKVVSAVVVGKTPSPAGRTPTFGSFWINEQRCLAICPDKKRRLGRLDQGFVAVLGHFIQNFNVDGPKIALILLGQGIPIAEAMLRSKICSISF